MEGLRLRRRSGRRLGGVLTLLADEDETGEFMILEQYVASTKRPFEPLRPRRHHATTGWNNEGIILSAEIYPTDHVLRGLTSVATS